MNRPAFFFFLTVAFAPPLFAEPALLTQKGRDAESLPREIERLRERQAENLLKMQERIDEIERYHPEYVRKYPQSFVRVKATEKYLRQSLHYFEKAEIEKSFQVQTDFFSKMSSILVDGINFMKDEKEKNAPPIGTFLKKEGVQVRYPKEKKMTVGRTPFFETQKFDKQKLVTHTLEEEETTPPEEDSYLEALDEKFDRQFRQKPESEAVKKAKSGTGALDLGAQIAEKMMGVPSGNEAGAGSGAGSGSGNNLSFGGQGPRNPGTAGSLGAEKAQLLEMTSGVSGQSGSGSGSGAGSGAGAGSGSGTAGGKSGSAQKKTEEKNQNPMPGASPKSNKEETQKTQSLTENLEKILDKKEQLSPDTAEPEKEHKTLENDQTVSLIREWLLQEKLLIQELKRFKPVRQPNNPNPPWEYYVLRQKQQIVQLKQIRRRIEFTGKKDEFFLELRKLSKISNRLLELMNMGEYTEYPAAAKAYDLILQEVTGAVPEAPQTAKKIMPSASQDEDSPDAYRAMNSRYFELLSEG